MKIKLVEKFGELIKDTKYYILMCSTEPKDEIFIHYDETLNKIVTGYYEFSDSFEAIYNYEKCLDYYKKPDASIVIREAEIL